MKIFLTAINAKYIHSNLAVYSLKAYTGEYEKYVAIGEYTINNRVDDILEQIYKEKPDVLCFSCYIWNMDYVGRWTGGLLRGRYILKRTSTGHWCDDRGGGAHLPRIL